MKAKILLGLLTSLFLLISCGGLQEAEKNSEARSSKPAKTNFNFTDTEITASSKLRYYCKACHAIGPLRFIYSDNDEELWNYILTNKSPRSQKLWADAITEVLNWPSDAPPPAEPIMDPVGKRDWMPKGSKRLDMAVDKVDGSSVRQIILDALKAARDNR